MIPYLCEGQVLDKTLKPKILLNDCLSCIVTEELNGEYELIANLPVQSEYTKLISVGMFLFAKPSPQQGCQYFKIYKIHTELSGNTVIYAEHLRYILNYYPCPMVYGRNLEALLSAIQNSVSYSLFPFSFFTNSTIDTALQIDCTKTIGNLIAGTENSIIDIYGGEWIFNNYACHHLTKRGSNKNIIFQYGYDIKNCVSEIEELNNYTHIFPFYEWELTDGTVATITLTHKSLESKYPYLTTRDLIQISQNYSTGHLMKVYALNLAKEFDLDLNVGYEKLNIQPMAENWIAQNKAELLGLDISYTLTFEYLKTNTALAKCELGDTIRVRIPTMNLETSARITKTTYDCLNEVYIQLNINSLKKKIDSFISQNSMNFKKNSRDIARLKTLLSS